MKYCFSIILIIASSPVIFSQNLSQLTYSELDSMMYLEYYNGAYDKAIPYMQEGQNRAKKEFGERDSVYGEYTSNLAFFYTQIGQYQKAEPLYMIAMDIDKRTVGENSSRYAATLNNLADLYKATGQLEKAEALYFRAKNIWAKTIGEEDVDYAVGITNLATVYQMMGSYEKSEPLYLQAKNIVEKALGQEHHVFASSINNLALMYKLTNDFEKAEPLFIQAKNIFAKTVGELHPDFATSLNNLASLYQDMGSYKTAEPLLLQAKNIWAKVLGEQHPDYCSSLNNLANLYKDMKLYEKSESLYLQTANIRAKIFGKKHPIFALSMNNLADLYQAMGKLDTALLYCKWGFIANCVALDSSFQNWSELDQFQYFSNEQFDHSSKTFLSVLNDQYKKTNDKTTLELSYQVAQAAMRLNERIRNDFSGDGDKLRNLANNSYFVVQGIGNAIALAKPGYEQEAFGFAEMNKGALLMDAAKTSNAHKFGNLPDSLATQEIRLQKKHSNLQVQLLEKLPKNIKDSLLNVLNETKQEIENFTKTLKAKYPKYAALKYENKTAKATDIQALLEDKTALLEYVIGDTTIYIFYVDKKNIILKEKKISHYILAAKIKDLHTVLSDYNFIAKEKSLAYQKYTENAHWFYENLIAPVLQKDKGISKLIIVSDGELGHLPFEVFLTKPASQKETNYNNLNYLINDYTISYNYSATIFADAVRSGGKTSKEAVKTPNNGQLLAMASDYNIKIDNKNFDWRLPAHHRLRSGLKPLVEAQKEVQILSESFNGFFAFDKNASEKIFKEKAGDYAIIHLAMHGLLDAKNPILSSLAFTEDGDSVENNFLQAYEISKMKLNADLVILSACETGFGKFDKGNGIASLAQAFAYAGAPAMIVTLWQVNDFATSEIMKNLYQNLANGMTKDQALQEAKIKYLKEAQGIAAHPAFWSPFVLIGNTDAVHLKTKGGFWWWILGGGIVLLSGGLIALRSRKKV